MFLRWLSKPGELQIRSVAGIRAAQSDELCSGLGGGRTCGICVNQLSMGSKAGVWREPLLQQQLLWQVSDVRKSVKLGG